MKQILITKVIIITIPILMGWMKKPRLWHRI